MKVIQITEKQQGWNMRNQMLNNPVTEETAGKAGRTKLWKQE